MKCHRRKFNRKMLMASLLTLPLHSTVAFADPLVESDCSVGLCESQNYAQRRGEGRQAGRGGPEKLMEQLNLTEEQVNELNSIRQKYRPQMEQLWEKMQTIRQDLRQMMQGNTSTADIRAKHQEVISLDQQIHNLRFESMLEMRETLTPEQRAQFAELMEERRAARRNGRRRNQFTP